MEATLHEKTALRHRFIQDNGAPVNVLHDPYFMKRLNLFNNEFGTLDAYNKYVDHVKRAYDGNISMFLEEYHSLRDRIINAVANSEAFKAFNSDEGITKCIKDFKPIQGERNLYNQESAKVGSNSFLSIDLRKANFQTLRRINPEIVLNANTYDEFISKFTDSSIVAESKRTRQIIFGKLNPHRTMKYEKILVGLMEEHLRTNPTIHMEMFDLYSMNSDELIYKLKDGMTFDEVPEGLKETIESAIRGNIGLDARVQMFNLNIHSFKIAESDNQTHVYTKDFIDGGREFKCANEIYFAQTYKLINNMDVEDDDLVFYYNKLELAKFLQPLTKIS